MSIWSDMEDRSAGLTKRKEDEIEEDYHLKVFYGAVNSIEDLPQKDQQGRIYVIEDTNQLIIFKNNRWTSIGPSIYSR